MFPFGIIFAEWEFFQMKRKYRRKTRDTEVLYSS